MRQLIGFYKNLLIQNEKKNLYLIFILGIVASVIDSLSIGIIPIYLLSITDTESFLQFAPNFLKNFIILLKNENDLIMYSSIIIIILFLIKNIFLYLINISIMMLFLTIREGIMYRSAKHFIYANYNTFLKLNSANIIRNVTGESLNTSNCLRDFVLLSQELFLVIFIITFSSFVYPEIVLPGLGIIFCLSIFFILVTKKYLKKLGEINVKLRSNFIKTVNHMFGSFKEIKIFKNEKYMLSFFKESLSDEITNIKKINIISIVPKYLVEIFAIGLIIFILTYLLYQDNEIKNHIPMLALFASVVIKIMPSVIKINQIFSKISTTYKSVEIINNLKILNIEENIKNNKINKNININFKNSINFKNVSFQYFKTRGLVLKNLNFKIKKNHLTLITGPSGSGKSTIIELISGLLKPTNGTIDVDDINMNEITSNWQDNISYMPQDIYLMDDTIINNVLLDQYHRSAEINLDKILKKVNLYDFVNKLPNKYDEKLGDKASNLSGGQIKRFGLARCLAKNRSILILDEPTAGLDSINSQKLILLIKDISKIFTVIVVSHNSDFQKIADNVIELSKLNSN